MYELFTQHFTKHAKCFLFFLKYLFLIHLIFTFNILFQKRHYVPHLQPNNQTIYQGCIHWQTSDRHHLFIFRKQMFFLCHSILWTLTLLTTIFAEMHFHRPADVREFQTDNLHVSNCVNTVGSCKCCHYDIGDTECRWYKVSDMCQRKEIEIN